MKRVLLMGGTGAMGCYLVDILSRQGEWDVWVTSRSERLSEQPNVHYHHGNARDQHFIEHILREKYDAIVDFMNYDYEEFVHRNRLLLAATSHYIWFSSCRVYADSATPLTECSARLLETSADTQFLKTNRYALRKARQENILQNSGYNNYTIIRPYITYGTNRLQLGIYEKEQWLWRVLKGKALVINKDILHKTTAMSHGYDVATAISKIVGNPNAHKQIFQIATSETMRWVEILGIYSEALEQHTGKKPRIYTADTMKPIDELYEGGYNTIYDRVYDRSFDSSYINKALGIEVMYTSMKTGIRRCIQEFLNQELPTLAINPQFEAYQDILTGDFLTEDDFDSSLQYQEYLRYKASAPASLKLSKLKLVDL